MAETDLAPEIQILQQHLADIIRDFSLAPDILAGSNPDFDLLMEMDCNYVSVSDFVDTLQSDLVDTAIRDTFGEDVSARRIVVAPCSPLFAELLEHIEATYPNTIFIDKHRAGATIGKAVVLASDDYCYQAGDIGLIATRNTEASAAYRGVFGADNYIDFLEVYNHHKLSISREGADSFIDTLNTVDKKLVFSSPRPLGTLASTVLELNKRGYHAYWLGAEEVKEEYQIGYSTPRISDMAFDGYFICGLLDIIRVAAGMKDGGFIFHYEALYPPNWDFERVALCYAACLAVIRTVKSMRPASHRSKLVLYMYDAIKPGVKNFNSAPHASALYKAMVTEAEGLIFSSYTAEFGDFLENALEAQLPRVHCHRYQIMPKDRRLRLTDGYHIAIISVLLEEFWEPSRMGLVDTIAALIHKGCHVHYYCSDVDHPKLHEFRENLAPNDRPRFHVHRPIHDLHELSSELSQYHVGWSLFNMQIFDTMVSEIDDQFMRDAMEMFTPTTLPSVIWTTAAAGLPVVCNRSMRGVVEMLPDGFTIPLTVSEARNLPMLLEAVDWTKIDSTPLDSLDIRNQIDPLVNFLERLVFQ